MLPYCYQAYGLTIASAIECPQLVPAEGLPDVNIRYGSLPDPYVAPLDQNTLSGQRFLFHFLTIGRFLIRNGNEIIISREAGVSDSKVRACLLGSCLGCLLYQRGLLPLHASAIRTARGAVLFAGPSGVGKSTLLSAFLARGYPMLADDIAGIATTADGQPIVLPAYPQLKLWAEMCDKIEQSTHGLSRVLPHLDKFLIPTRTQFVTEQLPLYAVYSLATHSQPEIQLTSIEGAQKFHILIESAYNKRLVAGLGVGRQQFRLTTLTAMAAKVTRVSRPTHPFLLDALADRIEAEFA